MIAQTVGTLIREEVDDDVPVPLPDDDTAEEAETDTLGNLAKAKSLCGSHISVIDPGRKKDPTAAVADTKGDFLQQNCREWRLKKRGEASKYTLYHLSYNYFLQ